jgi:hypothetical protein
MNADTLHQDMYLYDVYSEYLNKIKYYSLNSTINSLSIRYYKVNLDKTIGVESDLSMITVGQELITYDIYDFTPVLESAPLSYSTENDEDGQGLIRKTRGTLTVLAVTEPLPGDIFNLYQNGSTNEFFTVEDVNYVQSVKDLNIYQINFATSQLYKQTVNDLSVGAHFYYVKEFHNFFVSDLYDDYKNLLTNRNYMVDHINEFYDYNACKYIDKNMTDAQTTLANSMILYLNELVQINSKVIIGYSIIKDIPNDYALRLQDTDCLYDDPINGPTQIHLMIKIKELQDVYFKFILYQIPTDYLPQNPDTLHNDTTGVAIVKDLNGNAIGTIPAPVGVQCEMDIKWD